MKKNILLIHLESVNKLNYSLNKHLFPFLSSIESSCVFFNNFFSTATSTLMVIGDLMYGDMDQYESLENLNESDGPANYKYTVSIFDELKENGYNTGIYIYPDGAGREAAERRHLAGFQHKMELIRDYDEYLAAFAKKMDTPPFALMACNYISNIGHNFHLDISPYDLDTGFLEAGYMELDRCCRDLFQLLKERNLLDDTVVILYGDHGDDYWGHGLHSGWAHGIEPNSLQIHTPMMIWDGKERRETEHNNLLLQTTDLTDIIRSAVNSEEIYYPDERRYSFSRSAYARQPVRVDSFNKAYSVTDGRYLLMVSCHGLELYDMMFDPTCMNNLLRFFSYEHEVLVIKPDLKTHLQTYLNLREQRIIRQKFYELKEVLREKTITSYIAGGLTEEYMLKEMNFNVGVPSRVV